MRRGWIIGIGILTAIALLTAWRLIAEGKGKGGTPTGTLCVQVLDGRTLAPVRGALVVIPEADKRETTDGDGRTAVIEAPVLKDARLDGIQPTPWGEVTVLVYCPGYYPYALFHCNVRAGLDRNGPTVYLFPDDGSLTEPFSVIESPDPAWVQALIEKYEPFTG